MAKRTRHLKAPARRTAVKHGARAAKKVSSAAMIRRNFGDVLRALSKE